MNKVLTLYSSARPDGNTFQLVKTFEHMVPNELCYLDDLNIQEFDYQFNNQDDDFVSIINKMLEVNVILLASPVYWYSLTPRLRTFFDRFTDLMELPNLKPKGKQLREKSFYLLSTSVESQPPVSFIEPVTKSLQYLGWQFKGRAHLNCREGFDKASAVSNLRPLVDKLSATDIDSQAGLYERLSRFK